MKVSLCTFRACKEKMCSASICQEPDISVGQIAKRIQPLADTVMVIREARNKGGPVFQCRTRCALCEEKSPNDGMTVVADYTPSQGKWSVDAAGIKQCDDHCHDKCYMDRLINKWKNYSLACFEYEKGLFTFDAGFKDRSHTYNDTTGKIEAAFEQQCHGHVPLTSYMTGYGGVVFDCGAECLNPSLRQQCCKECNKLHPEDIKWMDAKNARLNHAPNMHADYVSCLGCADVEISTVAAASVVDESDVPNTCQVHETGYFNCSNDAHCGTGKPESKVLAAPTCTSTPCDQCGNVPSFKAECCYKCLSAVNTNCSEGSNQHLCKGCSEDDFDKFHATYGSKLRAAGLEVSWDDTTKLYLQKPAIQTVRHAAQSVLTTNRALQHWCDKIASNSCPGFLEQATCLSEACALGCGFSSAYGVEQDTCQQYGSVQTTVANLLAAGLHTNLSISSSPSVTCTDTRANTIGRMLQEHIANTQCAATLQESTHAGGFHLQSAIVDELRSERENGPFPASSTAAASEKWGVVEEGKFDLLAECRSARTCDLGCRTEVEKLIKMWKELDCLANLVGSDEQTMCSVESTQFENPRIACNWGQQCKGGYVQVYRFELAYRTLTFNCDKCPEAYNREDCCTECLNLNQNTQGLVGTDLVICNGCAHLTQMCYPTDRCTFDAATGNITCNYATSCKVGEVAGPIKEDVQACYVTPCDNCKGDDKDNEGTLRAQCCRKCLKHKRDNPYEREHFICQGCDEESFLKVKEKSSKCPPAAASLRHPEGLQKQAANLATAAVSLRQRQAQNEQEDSDGDNWPLIFGLICGLVALLGSMAMCVHRNREQDARSLEENEETETESDMGGE
eukprot:gnl/TRDRNA2_/TRDRNA2_177869_c0_seq6.p1 gnl/TRDRNA2_/TRDRNA2_177869_c0~~gnl/TRDRNA2_/TRDRNA2_177869_c0_seq6.p1  ORF type:complete len:958 (-),score=113.59 gnl/TRDRNA2_/TRDRNA2_177869_c0_seq6:138-2684(-)